MTPSVNIPRKGLLLVALVLASCTGEVRDASPAIPRLAVSLAAAGEPVWITVGPMATARERHTATLLPSGKVLVAGGSDATGASTATAELYDPATGTWSATAPMVTAREGHTATLLSSGKVLVAGGAEGELARSIEQYDPATASWSPAGLMSIPRSDHTATLLASGSVLLVGGNSTDGVTPSAELFDPATGVSTTVAPLLHERWGHTATVLPTGHVLVAGGRDQAEVETAGAELFDPATRGWTETGCLSYGRKLHTATLLASGAVLVSGGINGETGLLAPAEVFVESSGAWTVTGSLEVPRYKSRAVLLASGKVLMAAGETGADDSAAAELYDPASGTWSTTAPLNVARRWHTATLLPSGAVLVAGGSGSASAEVYDPMEGTSALTIWPLSVETAPLGEVAFTATGGSGSGYTWSLLSDASGAAIDPVTGAYKAGSSGGTADVVQVTDSVGHHASRAINVIGVPSTPPSGDALVVTSVSSLPPRGSAPLGVTGGAGGWCTWWLETNASGGTVSGAVYTAGARGEVVDVVRVTDSAGSTATHAITVTRGVSITVAGGTLVAPRGRRTLSASGGSGTGYRWSLLTNASHAGVDPVTGEYLAGSLGGATDVVQTVDSLGNVATQSITVAPWHVEGSGGCASGRGGGATTVALFAAAAILLRRRRRGRRSPAGAAAVILIALLAAPTARAGGFANERLQPSAGAHDVLGVESALVPPHLAVSGAAYLSYADEPLRLTAADSRASLVAGQTTLTVGASLGLLDRFELALALPMSVQQAGRITTFGPGLDAPSGAGIGDLLLVPKAQLYSASGFSTALALPVTLPTGSSDAYLGHGSVTASPRFILEYEVAPGVRLAGNAGLALRSASKRLDLEVGNAVTYAVAAEVPFRLAHQRMSAVASLGGEAQLNSAGGDPGLEALAGVTWHGPLGLAVTLGGGPGLTHGYGTPRYRVLTAVAFTPGSAVGARRGEVLAASVSPGPAPRSTAPEADVTPPAAVAPVVEVTIAPAAAQTPLELPRRLGTIPFAFASEKLAEDAAPELDRIAAAMMAEPNLRLRIEGHADRRGPASYNQVLSERRARAVRDALARRGVAVPRMQVVGFGATRPVDPAWNLRAYARNRRAEIEGDRAGAMAQK